MFLIGPIWRRQIDAFKRKRTNGELTYEDPFEGQYKVDTGDCIDKIQYVCEHDIQYPITVIGHNP
jgi:hypothetical protein